MNVLTYKGKKYIFRNLKESDSDFINDKFAEENKPVGLQNFKENISNFDDIQLLSMSLTIIMHYLLVSVDGKKIDKTAEEFIKDFGTDYESVATLYKQLNLCVGNTEKDVKKAGKYLKKIKKLKKQNNELKYKLFQEKSKNISLSFNSTGK